MFERKDTPTIMDGMVVRYQRTASGYNDLEISASRNKVHVAGCLDIHSRSLLMETIQTLATAFVQYQELAPNSGALYNRREPLPDDDADAIAHRLLADLIAQAVRLRGIAVEAS